jgi:predicted DNA-binding transcriptional regulator YafY
MAFRKLSAQLDDTERFTIHNLDEVLSFRPFAPEDPDLKLFELVTHALTTRQAMTFQYRKLGEKSPQVRHVHPYHLMEFGDRWYLIGHDLKRGELRKFVLGRMREPAVTDEHFVKPRNFNPNELFKKSLGIMTGKGDYEIVIEMDAWLTDVLRGRRWHPSQVVKELPSGGSHLHMRLSCLEEIEQYILSWGTHATVIGPTELITRIADTTRTLADRYANAPTSTGAPALGEGEVSLSFGDHVT